MIEHEIYIVRLLAALDRAGPSPVIRHRGHSISGAALLRSIFQYAHALKDMGIGRGALLGIFAPNRPEALAVRYAAHVLGAAVTFLPAPAAEPQRRALLETIAPDLTVVFPETRHCLPSRPGLRVATIGIDQPEAVGRLDRLASAASSAPLEVLARAIDLAIVASSGGSTAIPKGSCRSFAAYSAMVSAPDSPGRVQLINGPLAYLSQVLVDITLLTGGRIVLDDACDPQHTLAAIESERVTDLFLVEPQLFELMDDPEVDAHDLTSLRALTHIGASAPQCLRERARKRFGPIIVHLYGASEMGIVSILPPAEADTNPARLVTAGRIRSGVEVRFRRADGALAASGETGVIEVRSAAVAAGYRNNPALTSEHFMSGWYGTGDLGRLDDQGFLHILGRATDAQECNGRLVMPTEIEDQLCRMPTVRYAAVIRDSEAQVTVAAVVARNNVHIDPDECMRAVSARFGRDVAGSFVIVPLDRVPLTEQGKPDRAAIKTMARQLVQHRARAEVALQPGCGPLETSDQVG